jgi:hypothetical protein
MKRMLVALAVLTLAAATASAAWVDDFESYTLGSIAGQGGWNGWAASPTEAGVVVGAPAIGTRSQKIETTLPAYTDSVHEYAETSGHWYYDAQMYVPGNSTLGKTYFILMNNYSPTPAGWAIQLEFNLATGVLDVSETAVAENKPIVRDQWVPLRFDIDLDLNRVFVSYNGADVMGGYIRWYDPNDTGHQKAIEAVDLYSDYATVVSPVYYDNMSLTPEPAAFALLAVGLLLRRR